MIWQQYVLIVAAAVGVLSYVVQAGKPRPNYPTGWALALFLTLEAGYVALVVSI